MIYIFVRMKKYMSQFQYMLGILCKKNMSLFSFKYLCFDTLRKILDTHFLATQHVWKKMRFFFLVRLLVWKWTYVILTHSKMTTFLSATNSKRKNRLCEDFIFKAIISSSSIPLSQPLNTWRDSKVQFRPNYLKSNVKKDWTFMFRDIQSGVYTKKLGKEQQKHIEWEN